ncbi:MAG: PKD domain-containing protein, partial [Thermoplasmata archaeon]|nr:PKD domain-containing protein [Thermoplasmata archaeon]
MYRDTKKVYVTAIVALLLLSGFVSFTSFSHNARADTKEIFGRVIDTYGPIKKAAVTLTNLHTHTSYEASSGDPTGTYKFLNPSSGMYEINVQKSDYFTNKSDPFRFDATDNLEMDFLLEKMPDRDIWLNGTVGTNPTDVVNELLVFTTGEVKNQFVNNYYNIFDTKVTLPNPGPVVNGTVVGLWNGTILNESTDFTILDLWEGIIKIDNATIIANLNKQPQEGTLIFYYDYSETYANFLDNPVVFGSIIVNKTDGVTHLDPWPMENNYSIDHSSGTITVLSNVTFGIDSVRVDYTHYDLVIEAMITLFNYTHEQNVAKQVITDGKFSIPIWAGEFELICEAEDFESKVMPNYIMTSSTEMTILLKSTYTVWGYVKDLDTGLYIDTGGVVAYLYNTNASVPLSKRLIEAEVTDEYFTFNAYLESYFLILDANGYEALTTPLSVTGDMGPLTYSLSKSNEESYETDISFIANDWNNMTIYRNITLNADSRILGMDYDNLRNAELQIDLALGDGDGTLSPMEFNPGFLNWILERGPDYITTEGFLSINSYDYISLFNGPNPSDTEFAASVKRGGNKIWINTTTTYTTNYTDFTVGSIGSGMISLDQITHWLNLTLQQDTSTDVYRNYSYLVRLPIAPDGIGYEVNHSQSSNNVNVSGWVDISIDPSSQPPASPTCRFIIDKSVGGTANAKVTGPSGKYEPLNSSFDNYSAIVAQDEEIEFSAADSSDPNANIHDANYTWYFKFVTDPGEMGYGEEPTYNYTDAGDYTVKLVMTEAGGNVSTREINVLVDGLDPTALIESNVTMTTSGPNKILYVNQSVPVLLDGSNSTDNIYGSAPGEIEEWRWWRKYLDNDTAIPEEHLGDKWVTVFEYPGVYNVNLTVTDVVGHVSTTTNITVIVADTEAPTANFQVLDNETWASRNTVVEGKLFWFNASISTDNYDSVENMTFDWDMGDGTVLTGMNVSHTYYITGPIQVTLNATDSSGNTGNTTYSLQIAPNPELHPDLRIELDSFYVAPASPEEGDPETKLSINITNKEGHSTANN